MKFRLWPASHLAVDRRREMNGFPVIPANAFAFELRRLKNAGIQDWTPAPHRVRGKPIQGRRGTCFAG
jgi:hypothetical protein